MTDYQLILSSSLAFVLLLDLITVAARTGLLNANLVRLYALGESRQAELDRVLLLVNPGNFPRVRASLFLAMGILRFFTAGLALLLAMTWQVSLSLYLWAAVVLLVSALIVSLLEWMVVERVVSNSETWAFRMAGYIRIFMFLLYPLTTLTLVFGSGPKASESNATTVTEDELKSMVDAGQQEGVLEQDEREMIYSIFRLGDTLAREIMVPRIDITALDVQTPFDEAVDEMLKSTFSRLPVYEESIDNILGLLYTKDLLRVWRQGSQPNSLRDLLRPPYFVPEAKKVDELLAEMQSGRIHMAIIVDEYGGVAGLVTLEDIVEEIVGEIQDEFDQAEELPYQEVEPGEYVFLGRIDLDDFNEVMKSHLPRDEAETLGGFIYNKVGRVPTSGENLQIDHLLLTVEQVIGRRIRKVRAQWLPMMEENQEEKSNVDK